MDEHDHLIRTLLEQLEQILWPGVLENDRRVACAGVDVDRSVDLLRDIEEAPEQRVAHRLSASRVSAQSLARQRSKAAFASEVDQCLTSSPTM